MYRQGQKLDEFDLYSAFTKGQLKKDIKLIDQDVIYVSNRISTVAISGEIFRPAYFELKHDESLESLIDFGGGLKPSALNNVILKRIEGQNSNRSVKHYQISLGQMDKFFMQDGDSIHVFKLQAVDKIVRISGRVLQPGEYTYTESMRLSDLLLMAGGFNDSIWWESVDFNNVSISRLNELGIVKSIKVDLRSMLEGDQEQNPSLKAFDQILIPINSNFNFSRNNGKVLWFFI